MVLSISIRAIKQLVHEHCPVCLIWSTLIRPITNDFITIHVFKLVMHSILPLSDGPSQCWVFALCLEVDDCVMKYKITPYPVCVDLEVFFSSALGDGVLWGIGNVLLDQWTHAKHEHESKTNRKTSTTQERLILKVFWSLIKQPFYDFLKGGIHHFSSA